MKHISDSELAELLFGEAGADLQARWAEHQSRCPACHARFNAWRGARASMDRWPAAPSRARVFGRSSVGAWAAAAVLMLGLGLAGGWWVRGQGNQRDISRVRQELQADWDLKLAQARADLASEFADQLDDARAEDAVWIAAALQSLREDNAQALARVSGGLQTWVADAQAHFQEADSHLRRFEETRSPEGRVPVP